MGKRPFYVIDEYYELDEGGDRNSKVLCILHKKEDAIARFTYLYNTTKDDFRDDDGDLCDTNFEINKLDNGSIRGSFYFNDDRRNDYLSCRLSEIFTDVFKNPAEEVLYQNIVRDNPQVAVVAVRE